MRLRRADCSRPGITRIRRGRGIAYMAPDGTRITDPATLERIGKLAIPPAWRDVWICPWANGHIQAIGTDEAGRRQYRYHDVWREQQDRVKHSRLLEFARRLPAAREKIQSDLAGTGLTRERVLAAAVRLLDLGFFRIGSEEYAQAHETYGLATMRRDHVTISPDGVITFDYVAKGSKEQSKSVADGGLLSVVGALKRRRGGGDELLAYRGPQGWVDVKSSDINDHIRTLFGGDFTAKDFRTWNATVMAAAFLATAEQVASSPTARKRAIANAVRDVAHHLGNTPAVCRKSYIDPRVVDLYEDGVTLVDHLALLGEGASYGQPATQGPFENCVVELLSEPPVRRRALVARRPVRLSGATRAPPGRKAAAGGGRAGTGKPLPATG